MKNIVLSFLVLIPLCISGCQSVQEPIEAEPEPEREVKMNIQNSYPPQEDDSELKEGIVYLDSTAWDDTAQTLTISGNLPNPCCQLRIETAQSGAELTVKVYSVLSADGLCAQMLEPFEADLVFENLSKDEVAISVNGEKVAY